MPATWIQDHFQSEIENGEATSIEWHNNSGIVQTLPATTEYLWTPHIVYGDENPDAFDGVWHEILASGPGDYSYMFFHGLPALTVPNGRTAVRFAGWEMETVDQVFKNSLTQATVSRTGGEVRWLEVGRRLVQPNGQGGSGGGGTD